MRHRKKINHLGRKSEHRKSMLANMASSLILHKRIETTVAKAKALKIYVEPLITKSKADSTHSRRTVFSFLKDKIAVTELFREVSPKIANRPGGYTRILKTGTRLGDSAEMCLIELVDFNENMLASNVEKAKPTARRSRKKKSTETKTDESKKETKVKKTGDTKSKKASSPDTEKSVEE
jgi:large subunit ribosomal protein L17